ncbi:MAG: plasmid mobilization relaxosome protein MobC [Salinivirgaceae bacterium]|nr:plasmid mobilization relaxosome protein MobC [Salinivirgaceae bacterium]
MKKNKGGRPRLTIGAKNKTLKMCVTDKQFQELQVKLKASQYRGMSDLLRAMVFDRRITILTEDTNLHKLLFELSKIGTNINQIAKRCNIDSIGGQPARLKLSDKYNISKAVSIMEEILNKVI